MLSFKEPRTAIDAKLDIVVEVLAAVGIHATVMRDGLGLARAQRTWPHDLQVTLWVTGWVEGVTHHTRPYRSVEVDETFVVLAFDRDGNILNHRRLPKRQKPTEDVEV